VGSVFVASPTIEVWPIPDWGISAIALLPLEQPTVANDKGSASVGIFLGGLGPTFRLRFPQARWQLSAGIGAGGAVLRIRGAARAPLVSATDVATSPTAYGTISVGVDVATDVLATASLMFGALVPRATIEFAGQPVAHWGGFYGSGTIGIALRFH